MSALVADIGGTHARFALAKDGRIGPIVRLDDAEFPEPQQMIAEALRRLGGPASSGAVIAAAGPVEDGCVALTNRAWRLDGSALRRRFDFRTVSIVNDFAAVARSLEVMDPGDLDLWRDGEGIAAGPRLAVGPGTGLGVAALIWSDGRAAVVASEAGHVRFGPAEPDEDEAFARLRRAGPVSAESLLSGPGLARLHAVLTGEALPPAEIGRRALCGDATTRISVALFSRLLGRFCGDMSLTFRAEGGLFLAGGVVRRLGAAFDRAAFLAAFDAHPPFEGWLRRRRVARIAAPEPGLLGCAAIARELIAD